MLTALAVLQGAALLLLVVRLGPGWRRRPPVRPRPDIDRAPAVSVLVPSYNEARRIGPCLEGLAAQGRVLGEVIVVDSRSTDGTDALVRTAASGDGRVRLVTDPPPPPGWVGKVWALQHGLEEARHEWVLGIDADTRARAGMVAAVVEVAETEGYDVVSFSPRFDGMTAAEQWLQPSMLLSLVYRFGAAGRAAPPADRLMANGQCFLARRSVLQRAGGYEAARRSWADDVTLARHLARAGARVGFLDGSLLYDVRAYESLGQMWREWGRSFDLSDATTRARQWLDVTFIALTQGLPIPVLLGMATGAVPAFRPLLWFNAAMLAIRVLMLGAIRRSYAQHTAGYWLSPTSDPLAAWRLLLSTARRPRQWRGRALVDDGDR